MAKGARFKVVSAVLCSRVSSMMCVLKNNIPTDICIKILICRCVGNVSAYARPRRGGGLNIIVLVRIGSLVC